MTHLEVGQSAGRCLYERHRQHSSDQHGNPPRKATLEVAPAIKQPGHNEKRYKQNGNANKRCDQNVVKHLSHSSSPMPPPYDTRRIA